MTTSPANNGAEALMALNSSSESKILNTSDTNTANGMSLAKLSGADFEYVMWKDKAVIGRNSSHGQVDVSIGLSSYVSRKHLQIFRERNRYFLQCLGKNGVFVDGQFQRLGGDPLPLKPACTIRFPSTNIRVYFSLVPSGEGENDKEIVGKVIQEPEKQRIPEVPSRTEIVEETMVLEPVTTTNVRISPERKPAYMKREPPHPYINPFVNKNFFSAPPSPTGTISAANSCPVSPRGGTSHMNITDNLKMAAAYAAKVVQERDEHLVQVAGNDSPPRDDQKPPYSYAQLIIQAISSSKNKHLTLSGIYAHITKHYPYYRTADKGWQNSIRHNLSLNRYFVKVPRSQEESGKGSFWRIDPASEHKLVEQAWRKRRQRGVPCFRAPLGNISATRSAPSSPVHSNPISPQPQLHSQEMQSMSQGPPSHQHPLSNQVYEKEQKVQFVQVPRYAQSAPGSPATLAPAIMTGTVSGMMSGHTLASIQQQNTAIINAKSMPMVTAVGKVIWPMDVTKPHAFSGASIIKPTNGNGVMTTEGVIRATTEAQKLSLVMPQPQQVVMVTGPRPSVQSYPVSLGTVITPTQMSVGHSNIQSAPILMKRQLSHPPLSNAEDIKRMKLDDEGMQDNSVNQK